MNQRWAIFISGRGSTAQAALDQFLPQVKIVVSSKNHVWGLARARRLGIPTLVLEKKPDWQELTQSLRRLGINRIFLLGFMKLLPDSFVQEWQGRMVNLHPSLLPLFPGLEAIEKSYQAGSPMGVTVHEVISEMDAGRRLLQARTLQAGETATHSLMQASLLIASDEQRLVRRWLAAHPPLLTES